MKILFDLQHPAHLHFFRNVIGLLTRNGHTVKVTGRDKDILVELARRYRIEVEFFGTARKGIINLSYELLYRQQRLYRIIREFKPDLMMAIAGTFISSLGWFLKIPVYVFYDTEHATISNLLAYPFASCVYVPRCYRKKLRVRHVRYDGYHELAYLHPNYFTPDPSVLAEAGLREGDRFTIVRFVGWGAAHDIGLKGFTDENKIRAIKEFERIGRVFISSEGSLPERLGSYRVPVGVEKIHHLMAYASLIFGESATMASEAAVLGVPAVYLDPVGRGYTDEQEKKYKIVFNFKTEEQVDAIKRGVELLGTGKREHWKEIGKRIVRENEDVTKLIFDVALKRPFTGEAHAGRKNGIGESRRENGQPMLTKGSLVDRCHDNLLKTASHFGLPIVVHEDVPAGISGPHDDHFANNLRVVSHLTILSYYLYRFTGDRGYLEWARASIPYIEMFIDPRTGVYLNRTHPGKDPNNGLIGQAWVIQALLYILDILEVEQRDRLIFDVVESHGFDDNNNVYRYPVRDGRRIAFLPDFTLNHQVWFSSVVGRLNALDKRKVFEREQRRFLETLKDKIRIKGHRINHLIPQDIPLAHKLQWLSNNPQKISTYLWRRLVRNYQSMVTGYIPFSLWGIYGSDVLFSALGDKKNLLDQVLNYFVQNPRIMKDNNPFAWGYNMSGIELAICYLRRFGALNDKVLYLISKQLNWPPEYVIGDHSTYKARHYELVFMLEALSECLTEQVNVSEEYPQESLA